MGFLQRFKMLRFLCFSPGSSAPTFARSRLRLVITILRLIYSESANPLISRRVAAYTSGIALRNRTSPAWQVPLTVRLYPLTPAARSF